MRSLVPVLGSLALSACGGSSVTYSGYSMSNYFPFDGSSRTWEFVSTDTTIPHKLVATLATPGTPSADGAMVFEVDYETQCVQADAEGCVDAWVRTLAWSSDGTRGTLLHSLETADGLTAFDPPIALTDDTMLVGDSVQTTTGGTTWTATFEGLDACPVVWTSEWGNQCIHLTLDDGGLGSELAGDYWAITQYNLVGFQLADDSGVWQLSNATFEAR